jgi:hypothetical protein
MGQRIPEYSYADFNRVLQREFPGGAGKEALSVLQTFSEGQWQGGSLRVHMACLKLANGNIASLRKYIQAAYGDPRDVIAWAEYGSYMKAKDPSSQQAAIEQDWQELQEWLAHT